jgi:Ca2+-binding RTX toxin-like protein
MAAGRVALGLGKEAKMATLNAGNALDMTNLQMANLQYGNTPIYDSTLLRVDDGGGRYVDFHGAFSYAATGGGTDPYGGMDPYGYGYAAGGYYPTSGTVTGVTEVTPAGTALDVTGLNVDAPTLFNAFQANDTATAFNDLFGGDDQVNGSTSADTLDGWGGNDTVAAADGNDAVRGLEGNDSIDGGGGDDDVNGNLGSDTVHGGDGADTVRGGQGGDLVFGDGGDDGHVNGNIGEDTVHGGIGNDTVFGGQGNDQVFGDEGDDQLSGDLGDDTLSGGAGADRFAMRPGGGHDVVTDFNAVEGDRILLNPGQAFTLSTVNGSAVVTLDTGDSLTLTGVAQASPDWLVFG